MFRLCFFNTEKIQVRVTAREQINFSDIHPKIKIVGTWGRDELLSMPAAHIQFSKEFETEIRASLYIHNQALRVDEQFTRLGSELYHSDHVYHLHFPRGRRLDGSLLE